MRVSFHRISSPPPGKAMGRRKYSRRRRGRQSHSASGNRCLTQDSNVSSSRPPACSLVPLCRRHFPCEEWQSQFLRHRRLEGNMNSADLFEAIVNEHYAPLFRFAMSLTRSESDACDLTQQTFYVWAKKGHQLRDISKV